MSYGPWRYLQSGREWRVSDARLYRTQVHPDLDLPGDFRACYLSNQDCCSSTRIRPKSKNKSGDLGRGKFTAAKL